MGTDRIDLQLGDHLIRVLCEDARASALLRGALDQHLTSEPGEPSFVLRVPTPSRRLHVLVDRGGMVLSRTRSVDEAVAVLGHHLAGFLPGPSDTVRVRLRALVGDNDQVVLAGFPVFASPLLVERRLERAGFRIVDRLNADLTQDARVLMAATPWSGLAGLPDAMGHTAPPERAFAITGLLLPAVGSTRETDASLVAYLASNVDADGATALDVAERLAALPRQSVEIGERGGATYDALSRLAG